MLEEPEVKYAEIPDDVREIVDIMIAELLKLMDTEPQLARDLGGMDRERRRESVIDLMDKGVLRIAEAGRGVGWEVYVEPIDSYVPIPGPDPAPEMN